MRSRTIRPLSIGKLRFLWLLLGAVASSCKISKEPGSVVGPEPATGLVTGLQAAYDTVAGVVRLSWDSGGTVGYVVFRREHGDGKPHLLVGEADGNAFVDTVYPGDRASGEHFRDSLTRLFGYRVGTRGQGGIPPGTDLEVRAAPPRMVRAVARFDVPPGRDTASPGDTVEVTVSFTNPTRALRSVEWRVDGQPLQGVRTAIADDPRRAESSLRVAFGSAGSRVVVASAEDVAGNVWRDSTKVHVIVDAPRADAGRDTLVRPGARVVLRGNGSDRFGFIRAWDWRCGNDVSFAPAHAGEISVLAPATEGDGYPCVLRVTDDDGMVGFDTIFLATQYWMPGAALAWELVGGQGARGSWDGGMPEFEEVRVLHEWKGKLYATLLTAAEAMKGQVWSFNGSRWELAGGDGTRGSWKVGTVMSVNALASDERYLYAGTGIHSGMARVWRFDGERWEQIGGDGLRGGWGDEIDCVWHMSMHKGNLYAGMVAEDAGVRRAPLYRFDGETWVLVAGLAGAENGWDPDAGYFMNYISVPDRDALYIGLAGREPGNGDVFQLDAGGRLRQIGGDGLYGSWSNPSAQFVEDAIMRGGDLLIALNGTRTGEDRDNPIWRYDGRAWSPVGDVPSEWRGDDCWIYNKLLEFRGELYLGVGGKATATSMWKLDAGGRWVKVGGHGLYGSTWNTGPDLDHTLWIYTITAYAGDLYIGLASAEKEGMAQVWRLSPGP